LSSTRKNQTLRFHAALCLGFSLLSSAAHAQPTATSITTQHGIVFPVPSTLSNLTLAAQHPGPVIGERAMSDRQENPVELTITNAPINPAGFAADLPAASGDLSAAFVRNFAAGMMNTLKPMFMGAAYTYTASSLGYDAPRHMFRVEVVTDIASAAHLLLHQDDSSEYWQEIRKGADGDTRMFRCIFEQLLAGANAATPAQLRSRYAATAKKCDGPVEAVDQFVQATGLETFEAQTLLTRVVGFLTKANLTLVRVTADESRKADLVAITDTIWKEATVPKEALPVPIAAAPIGPARNDTSKLIGFVVGGLFLMFGVGGLFTWVLLKLRVRPTVAVSAALGTLAALGVGTSALGAGETLQGVPRMLTYVVAAAIAFVPLHKWAKTKARGGS
jgi:hypothetical protein